MARASRHVLEILAGSCAVRLSSPGPGSAVAEVDSKDQTNIMII